MAEVNYILNGKTKPNPLPLEGNSPASYPQQATNQNAPAHPTASPYPAQSPYSALSHYPASAANHYTPASPDAPSDPFPAAHQFSQSNIMSNCIDMGQSLASAVSTGQTFGLVPTSAQKYGNFVYYETEKTPVRL
jgi:hypothetical protein